MAVYQFYFSYLVKLSVLTFQGKNIISQVSS
jgi:hypothetical protein